MTAKDVARRTKNKRYNKTRGKITVKKRRKEVFMAKRKIITAILTICILLSLLPIVALNSLAAQGEIKRASGWMESAYVEWTAISDAAAYNVYIAASDSDVWTQIDDMLIREYKDHFRADAIGLRAGSYRMKILPVRNGVEDTAAALVTSSLSVIAHDRSGFAFVNGTSSGAYNDDGTLKSGAKVIYVTNENKNNVSADIATGKNATTSVVGVYNILAAIKLGYEKSPVCIRFIGNITDPEILEKGDLLVDFGEGKFTGGMTIEGIGEDTVFNGFGIRMKGVSNLEIRNIAFMNCDSDEGDSISLQQNNHHVWVHNCDIFYGMAGADADQNKGDGSLDTKKSSYITHSYNHFWDSGKSCLLGNTGEMEENYITYHHNWFDHSDSRHPRVRTASVHVYNNFYDGISKYGVGATMGASVFAEANYFLNTKNPMLISRQGTDMSGGVGTFSGEDGGIIKALNNVFVNSTKVVDYSQNKTDFDVYTVTDKNETVPSYVTAKQGGADYNNFDTGSMMYSYEAQSAEDAMNTVKAYAGRVGGGDFKWTFKAGSEKSSSIDNDLKSAITEYKSGIISFGGSNNGGNNTPDDSGNTKPDDGGSSGGSTVPDSSQSHSFTNDGKTDPEQFFNIIGSTSTAKGSVTYNGQSLGVCLKIESSTNISFTTTSEGTLILVFGGSVNASGKYIKVNGAKCTIPESQILELKLDAGTHAVTKGDSINLFYMEYIPDAATPDKPEHSHSYKITVTDPTCTEAGYTTYTCSCGDTYRADEVAASGHSYSAKVTDPTCTEAGYTTYTCSCGDNYVGSITEPKGHSFKDGICSDCREADPDYKEDVTEPEDPTEPNGSDTQGGSEQPKKLGFFQRIWQAILNFLKRLFIKSE